MQISLAPLFTRSLRANMALAAGFLAAYVLLDWVSFVYPLRALNITPWSPQPAIAVALIALFGMRWIVWVFVTILFAEIIVRGSPVPFSLGLLLTAILTFGCAVTVGLLRWRAVRATELTGRVDIFRLAVACMAGAAITGVLYVTTLTYRGFITWGEYSQAWIRFWVGDAIGLLVTLPLLLLLANVSRRQELKMLLTRKETLLQIASLAGTLMLVFALGETELFKFFYLLFLPLIWISARHGLAGAIVAIAIIQVGIIVLVTLGGQKALTVIELQALLASLVLTGLFLGVTVDERKLAAEQLVRVRQLTAAGEMATALAHELNQPLTALSNYADAIKLIAKSPDSDRRLLVNTAERIQRMTTRSADIIARFRELAKTESHKTEPVPLNDLLHAAVDATQDRIERTGAFVEVDTPADLPPINMNRDRMAFVFQNLIGNAVDAIQDSMTAQRKVEIATRRDGNGHVVISVRDTGIGVRRDMLDKIFEPFYTHKSNGMGLGLAISRSIVESHGGRIWAEPADHGIFHIRLPI